MARPDAWRHRRNMQPLDRTDKLRDFRKRWNGKRKLHGREVWRRARRAWDAFCRAWRDGEIEE